MMSNKLLLPNSCWTCRHCVTYRWKVGARVDEDVCMLAVETIKMDDMPWKVRMSWCPLEEEESEE
jgi:hypothetical protein